MTGGGATDKNARKGQERGPICRVWVGKLASACVRLGIQHFPTCLTSFGDVARQETFERLPDFASLQPRRTGTVSSPSVVELQAKGVLSPFQNGGLCSTEDGFVRVYFLRQTNGELPFLFSSLFFLCCSPFKILMQSCGHCKILPCVSKDI